MEERIYTLSGVLDILKIDFGREKLDKIESKFLRLDTCEKRILFASSLSNLKSEDFVTHDDVGGVKSVAESVKFRRLGNEAYKQKDYSSALELYTKSVAYAPFPEQRSGQVLNPGVSEYETALSLALGNRSAALFETGKYEQCLKDISFAMKANYPQHLHKKIHIRQIKCLHALGRTQDIPDFGQVISEIPSLSEREMGELKMSLESKLKNITLLTSPQSSPLVESTAENIKKSEFTNIPTAITSALNSSIKKLESEPELKLNYEESKTVPGYSDCVEVRMTSDMGRGIFATKEIKTGDIITIQKPFASILYKDYFYSHCHHCCKSCLTLIPCSHCSLAMFCSEDCRSVSWKTYHRVECKLLPIITHIDLPPKLTLVLRIVIIASNFFKTIKEFYDTATEFDKIRSREFSSDYSFVHKEIKHIEYFNIYKPILKPFSTNNLNDFLITVFLLFLLENRSDFFSQFEEYSTSSESQKKAQKICIASLLRTHLLNPTYAIQPLQIDNVGRDNIIKAIGKAAYSQALDLTNHSCDENMISLTCFGNWKLLRALRNIQQGEQVFISYGPSYALRPLEQRQMLLSQIHGFTCHCIACTEKWPTLIEMKPEDYKLQCQSCKLPLPIRRQQQLKTCFNCHKIIKVQEVFETWDCLSHDFVAGNKMPLKDFIQSLEFLRSNIQNPCIVLATLQEQLKYRFGLEANNEI